MSTVYLAHDLETGALDPAKGDILTGYYAILDEDFKFLEELSLKLKPNDRLPIVEEKAMSVNKIDLQKHLADPETITYAEGAKRITAMVKRHLKKKGKYSNVIPFGYNILTFDIPWAQYHLIDRTTWESMIHYKALDVMQHIETLKFHKWLPPTVGTLVSAVEYFQVPKEEAHIAKNDIIMTVGVQKKINELMDSKKEGGTTQDLISLLEAE